MPQDKQTPMLVECTECSFSRVVSPEDDELPVDVIIEHGSEHGHTLNTEPVNE